MLTTGTDAGRDKKMGATDQHGRNTEKDKKEERNKMELLHKEVTEQIIGACFEVYKELGYGFLEKVYQRP